MKSITYPSGRVVATSFDLAGRVSGLNGILNGSPTAYVSGTSYAAQGSLSGMTTGDGLAGSWSYSAKLLPVQIVAGSQMTLGLTWNSNGTLQNQTIIRPGLNATQSYTYDGVNRLATAAEGSNWSQWYAYDSAGNRAVISNNSGQNSSLITPDYTPQTANAAPVPFNGNNQWNTAAGYDGAGNMTSMRTQTMTYDAESRTTGWADSSTGASVSFTYDGDGRRVTKTAGGTTTLYVYDPAGNLAAEYGGAAGTSGTTYLTQDHLGSTRLATSASGCVGAHDYLPFGEEIPGGWGRSGVSCYGQADTAMKFTGQERDAETEIDNFGARYMASAQGRFLVPDPAGNAVADPANPQSWNMYSYAWNNPLAFVDPSGLCSQDSNGNYYDDNNEGTTTLFAGPCANGTIGDYNPSPTAPPVLNGSDPNNPAVEGNTVTAQTDPFSFEALLQGASQFIENSPFPITFSVAVGVPQLLNTIGGQLSVTIIPDKRTLCVAPGLFVQPPTTSVVSGNVGLLMVGPLQNAAAIASGPGVTGTLQRTGPSGYQQTASSSGTLGGPTFGSRGINVSASIGACRVF